MFYDFMNSQVTCSTNLTQVLAKQLYNFIWFGIRLKNILKVMRTNENHCCPILTVYYGNWVSAISVDSPRYGHCLIWTPLCDKQ